eukprot:6207861-Pleurochrysis_carterae.AAC.1
MKLDDNTVTTPRARKGNSKHASAVHASRNQVACRSAVATCSEQNSANGLQSRHEGCSCYSRLIANTRSFLIKLADGALNDFLALLAELYLDLVNRKFPFIRGIRLEHLTHQARMPVDKAELVHRAGSLAALLQRLRLPVTTTACGRVQLSECGCSASVAMLGDFASVLKSCSNPSMEASRTWRSV